jgi:predicted metal-dependent peptidase
MSEMIGISKSYSNVEFHVLTHDTEVHDDIPIYNGHINKIKQLKIHGGGGTDSRCVYEYIHKKRYSRDIKLLICFTDGYTVWPEKPVKELYTICVLSGGHCPIEQVPSWIRTITLD